MDQPRKIETPCSLCKGYRCITRNIFTGEPGLRLCATFPDGYGRFRPLEQIREADAECEHFEAKEKKKNG